MRYTTVIDITQCQEVYRNINCRLVYLHLALRAGYHDHDRDLVRYSIRNLAADTGLTVGAVRNAIRRLTKWKLLSRHNDIWTVTKWVSEQPVTTRAKTAREQQRLTMAAMREQQSELREREAEIERIRRENLAANGKSSWSEYMDHLKEKAAAGDVEAQQLLKRHGG